MAVVQCRADSHKRLGGYFRCLFCVLIFHKHRCRRFDETLPVDSARLVYINSASGLLYYLDRLWHLFQLRDFKQPVALSALYPSVGGTGVKQPAVAAIRTLGNYLHYLTLYVNSC